MLRDYQQECYDAAMIFIRASLSPCLIEAATGAGKSHIIAALANSIHKQSEGKKVLCLQPSAELVEQNYEKFLATGNPASKFSASAGQICLRHPVVFGTPGTVKNRVNRFGGDIAAIIVDEAHEITPTIIAIIDAIREINPKVRVIGLTATPYRLRTGYIYAIDENDKPNPETSCVEPYFLKKVHTVPAHMLIKEGWLTPPVIGELNADGYETLDMELNSRGQFDKADIDKAFHGHGRKTAAVVADVVAQGINRKGVMFFAATIQHAEEILASLPPSLSAIITSKTAKAQRRNIIKSFKQRATKYIVNVGVLTRGFDAAHVDVIAILRATESVSLLQQIIGRGLRIDDGKLDCLVLDYAENIERHCPDGDVFNPKIKAGMVSGEKVLLDVHCPDCDTVNQFSARQNPEQFKSNKHGYFVDLEGQVIETDLGPMPSHHGRRCTGMFQSGYTHAQCTYRWTFKHCPHCDGDNDIAARYCTHCKGEIIDPNEKLMIEFKALKRNPRMVQTDKVISMRCRESVSKNGNTTLRVDFQTEYRKFSVWFMPGYSHGKKAKDYASFCEHTSAGKSTPRTVTYKKDADTSFYRIFDYNRAHDEAPN